VTDRPNGNAANAIAENVWTRILARFAMIGAAMALPAFGWVASDYLKRIETTGKEMLAEIRTGLAEGRKERSENTKKIIELQGQINLGVQKDADQDWRLNNHENRLDRYGEALRQRGTQE
jgi:hypothetical protein